MARISREKSISTQQFSREIQNDPPSKIRYSKSILSHATAQQVFLDMAQISREKLTSIS